MSFPPLDPRATRSHEFDEGQRRWIFVGVASLIAMIVVGAAFSMWLLRWRSAQARDVDRPRSVVSSTIALGGPPLQPSISHDRTPVEDLAAMRAREDAVFKTLGWSIDSTTHAPIVPDVVVARVRSRTNASATTSPATSKPTIAPLAGVDEGGPR